MRVIWKTNAMQRPKPIGPGLYMSLPGQVEITDMELLGAVYDVRMTLDLTPDGVKPTAVTVAAQEGSPPVTGTVLRAVPVQETTRQAIIQGVEWGPAEGNDGGELATANKGLTPELARALRRDGPTDTTLEWVAHLYELGKVLGMPPARFVEVNLDLPRTTASKWVRRAREGGQLGG